MLKSLSINQNNLIAFGSYFQKKTKETEGLQIDLLIQDKFNTLYLCEIKHHKQPIGPNIISEVERKITNLVRPKYFSLRPVLICSGKVSEELVRINYFDKIISFEEI